MTMDHVQAATFGRFGAHSLVVGFHGHNPAVGSGALETIWGLGGDYNFLQAAVALRVKAGGDAADTSAGAGARTITVYGLDENWELAQEVITLAGASASSPTTTTFIRVNKVEVTGCGTYGAPGDTGGNTGAIEVETTGAVTVAYIAAGDGRAQQAIYTVPSGYQALLMVNALSADTGSGKECTVKVMAREGADIVSAPFTSPRTLQEVVGLKGGSPGEHRGGHLFPARTDIWIESIGDTGASAVTACVELLLQSV